MPVFVFLTLFFIMSGISFQFFGKPDWNLATILGSYLLLNDPSIGYVWIMRVFLLMAVCLPLLDRIVRNVGFIGILLIIFGLIAIEQPLSFAVQSIPVKYMRFGLEQVIPYSAGYSALAILGLRLQHLNQREICTVLAISLTAILIFMGVHDMTFNPQAYKYPPQSLYLLYGVLASTLLWTLKPLIHKVTDNRVFRYLSRHSMWIYLWHIIPVYALTPWMGIPDLWFGRYAIVLTVAVVLNIFYQIFLNLLPPRLSKPLR